MSDPVPLPQPTPGKDTSEFSLAKLNQYAGLAFVVLMSVSGFLADLSGKFPNAKFLTTAGVVVGGLISVLSFLGYNKGRADLKMTLVEAQKELSK